MYLFSPGDGSNLYRQMIDSYTDSIAPGTAANRLTQAKAYVKFAVYYRVPVLYPSITHLCMYAQFLRNSYDAPATMRNYISGAKSWIGQHGGNITAFSAPEFLQLTQGFIKRSQHVPSRAQPLLWHHVRHVIDFMNSVPNVPLAAKPCLLIGFHTFLRASNLLSPSTGVWGGPHTLLAKHLRLSDAGLHITVLTTKTKSNPTPLSTIIPWHNDPVYCPAQAWLRYVTARRPCPVGPAFVTDDHRPLTSKHIVGLMRIALQDYPGIIVDKVTLHSLRRGAAQDAKLAGIPVERIMERGMWRSRAGLSPYLK